MRIALLAFLALACRTDDKNSTTDTSGLGGDSDTPVDADGDGWSADDDCDDGDASVRPDATESCNGVDDDCDGDIDEGVLSIWYADDDGDAYGDGARSTEACGAPEGYVADGNDCDDGDDTAYPGAPERCDDADNDCDGAIDEDVQDTWYADADGDDFGDAAAPLDSCDPPSGYVADATDCDDSSDVTYPGADEVCDAADNDCDSEVDEDAVDALTWYADADADGYGDAATTLTDCDEPAGYTDDATDCDDTRSEAFPGADETCNDADDDCDGSIDEDATDASTWYLDSDGDGYGGDSYSTDACDQPSGFEADTDDCDDTDASVSPDGVETCDGVDNDCDGSTDEDDATDADSWYADTDGDGFGDAGSTTTACSEPTGYTADDADCDDTDDTVFPGSTATETPGDGTDQDCDGNDLCTDLSCDGIPDLFVGNYYSGSSYTADQQLFYGDGSDFAATEDVALQGYGTWSTQASDVDGDGYQDLLVVNYYSGSSYYTNSYLYWGSATGYSSSDREDIQTYGAILADIADYDGDGYEDIAFAQHYPGAYAGYSYIYYGSSKGYSTGDMDYVPTIGSYGVASADFDGDGYRDLVYCNYYDGSSTNQDSYVYWGTVSGFTSSSRTDLETKGCRDVAVEDVDGDGYEDILFANYYEAGVGYTTDSYVYYGSSTGFSESDRAALPTAGALGVTTGDFDGDGQTDVAFGSHYSGSSYASNGYVYYGSSTGYSTADYDLVSSHGAWYVDSADLDGDGYDDLVIPSYRGSSSYTESTYVHYGSASGFTGTPTSLDTIGASRVSIGNLDGDGHPELVFNNYFSGSWSSLPDTYIYWGSAGAYSESDRTDLGTYGSWPVVQIVGDADW